MPAVAWNQAAFETAFPSFAPASSPAYPQLWVEAGFIVNNSGSGLISDVTELTLCLNLLTAHLATLQLGPDGGNSGEPSGIVGRVTNAQQGTVSVAASMGNTVKYDDAFFLQTQYGARFLQVIARFRGFRVYASPMAYGRRF
jgi:hypothetical protein